ncbi:hypothetical protein IWW42_000442 [Coemansia sp. RSA 1085]|nr:hypothetical protein IWW42_000442 [Coemansia sp. RSA 1085]
MYDNLCSKCFNDIKKANNQLASNATTKAAPAIPTQTPAVAAPIPVEPAARSQPAHNAGDVQGLGAASASPAASAAAADAGTVASELENKLLSGAVCEKSNSLPTTGTQSPLAQPPGTASGGTTPSKELYNKKGRCAQCKQRVQLAKQAINKCRCCYFFCDKHRYPKQHECDFDFMSSDRLTLEKNNPKLNSRPKGGLSFTRID